MEFLSKLYGNENFGIGLFIVICFLVIAFLVVLFFGKKDEKKRNNLAKEDANAFKDTSVATPLEVASNVQEVPTPTNEMNVNIPMEPIAPVTPLNPVDPIAPVAPLNFDVEEPTVTPTPLEMPTVPPIQNSSVAPFNEVNPTYIEPTKIDLNEPINVEPNIMPTPVIKTNQEVPTPIVDVHQEVAPTLNINANPEVPVTPIIEEPINFDTYYKPQEPINNVAPIEVPQIDFDAIARSINEDLTSIEQKQQEVKVTPINEINPTNPVYPGPSNPPLDMPQKMDLPKRREDNLL